MRRRVPDGWRRSRRFLYPIGIGLILYLFLAMLVDIIVFWGLDTLEDWAVLFHVVVAIGFSIFFFIIFFPELKLFGALEREYYFCDGIEKESLYSVLETVVLDQMARDGYKVEGIDYEGGTRRSRSSLTAADLMLDSDSSILPPVWFDYITDTRSVIVYVRPGHWNLIPIAEGAMMNLR